MTVPVDSRTIPRAERAEVIRQMASGIVPVELQFPSSVGPIVRGSVTDLGHLRLSSIRSNAAKVERTPKLARDQLGPCVLLGLQRGDSSVLIQHGREVIVRAGELVLYDSSAPYTLVDRAGYSQHQIRVPLDKLALPVDLVRRACAVRLSPGHPVADLAAAYFRRICADPQSFAAAGAEAVSTPSVELLRALITTQVDNCTLVADTMQATLATRILEYVRARLGDVDLNAQQIATEHHISVRHLYNVLAEVDISLGEWIRSHRLAACREELSQPRARLQTIASVSRRWGFRDASGFGRVFRNEYGLSPREWRDACLHTPEEDLQ